MMRLKLALLSMASMLAMANGCNFPGTAETENMEPHNVTIVGVGHSNEYRMSVEAYADQILQACDTAGTITVIDTGSNPKSLMAQSVKPIDRSLPKVKQKMKLQETTTYFINRIQKYEVTSDEVDVFEAFVLAARTGAREIVVYDSGLNTVGVLNMKMGYLDENCIDTPEMIAKRLSDSKRLPDLSGKTIIWFGCGDTCGNQKLSLRAVNRLKEIWSAVIIEAGGVVVFMDELPSSVECDSSYVSTVDVYEGDIEAPGFGPKIVTREYKESEKSELTFVGNEAKFLYEESAKEVLGNLAYELNSIYAGRDIVVIGTTATGDKERAKNLSEERAATVKETLVSYGVDPDRIVCYGFGCTYSRRVDDVDASGNLIEEKASQNRLVIIGDSKDSEISDILSENL